MVRGNVPHQLCVSPRRRRRVVAVSGRPLRQYVAEHVGQPTPTRSLHSRGIYALHPRSRVPCSVYALRRHPRRIGRRVLRGHVVAASVTQSAWNTGCAGFQPVISCSFVDAIRWDRISGSSRSPAIFTRSRGR